MVLVVSVTRDSKSVSFYRNAWSMTEFRKALENTSKMMSWKRSQNAGFRRLDLEGYNDIKTDDTIEAHIMEEIKIAGRSGKRGIFSDFLVFKHKAERVPMASDADRKHWNQAWSQQIYKRKSVTRVSSRRYYYGCSNARWFALGGQSAPFIMSDLSQTIKSAQTGWKWRTKTKPSTRCA